MPVRGGRVGRILYLWALQPKLSKGLDLCDQTLFYLIPYRFVANRNLPMQDDLSKVKSTQRKFLLGLKKSVFYWTDKALIGRIVKSRFGSFPLHKHWISLTKVSLGNRRQRSTDMQSVISGDIEAIETSDPKIGLPRTRLALILGITFLYMLVLHPLMNAIGPVASALISIPVALAGWYFGINAGLVAGLMGIVLNMALLTLIKGGAWYAWIIDYWPGNSVLILLGYIAGRVRHELADHAQALEELRSHERYLALVNLATQNILGSKNLDDTYYYLVTNLADLFGADHAHFFRWDASQKQAVLVASTLPLDRSLSDIQLDLNESGLIVSVLRTGRALVLDDLSDSKTIVNPAPLKKDTPPIQSALCIPVLAGENKLGAMVIGYNTPRRFSAKEINYAELAGNQIALALHSVQQDIEIQKRLKEAHALANIEHVLSETERVGIGTVLQLIVDSARDLIPDVENAVLHLIDDEQQTLIPRATAGFVNEARTKLNMRLGEGVAGQVILSGEVIIIADTETDSRFLNQSPPAKFRSLIVAPIQSNERCVGTISIQNKRPNAFTPDEGRLLGALGTQAAIAIENANLLQTTQQDLKEINALYQVSRGLAGSLDPDQLLKNVVDLLQQNFGYYHVQVYLVDHEHDALVARYGSGKIGDFLREQGYHLPVGTGIVGQVAETGEPFMTNDVERIVFFVRHPLLPDTQSNLTVPIKVDDQVVGVLDIQQVPPDRLTSRDMQLMTTVADQLAVALQKANLYSELQTSLSQERLMHAQLVQSERLAVIGRLLASVSHELNNPLQAIQNALFLVNDEENLSPQGHRDLEIVLSETERMAEMIKRLRAFYRPSRAEDFQDIELNNIAVEVSALTANHMRHKNITFEFIPDLELPVVPGIPDQIRQIVLNLFMNAVEAMQTGGHLTVYTRRLPEQDRILFSVTDTGPGIDPEILPHIFEPFMTNKENGTGLGLTITADIIRRHNGDIQAENNPEGGATFRVWLPKVRKELK
jgi:signal transduction histidine kinase